MRIKRLILLLLFFPLAAAAQTITISGKVVTSESHTGIGKVSVFLSNSSFGTESADDGSFTLVGVKPGQYTLVASSVGFQEYTQSILISDVPITMDIVMQSKVMQLRGVVISSDADFKKNFEIFKREFIGTTENSKKCEIMNPRDVNMIYHGHTQELEAWTNGFLVMENRALGYRVKFLVDTFSTSKLTGVTQWNGQAVFQELPGSAAQKKIWKQKREDTYYGSSRHFFHALYTNTLTQDGFVMRRLHRELNPERPDEAVIQQKIKFFKERFIQSRTKNNADSVNYWILKETLSKYYHEYLGKDPLQPYMVYQQTSQPGIYALRFTDCLYVIYTRRREETDFKDIYRPLDMENFETSVLTLNAPYAVFDKNGVVFQGVPISEGTWSKARLSELLPFDYNPQDDNKESN